MLAVSMIKLFMSSHKAVEEEDKMTPEQLAIKNVGKQVKCLCVRGKKHIVLIRCTFKAIGLQNKLIFLLICFLCAGSQEALGRTRRCFDDIQHCSVPSCHAGYSSFPVMALSV